MKKITDQEVRKEYLTPVGARLATERTRLGFSQAELSSLCGITRQTQLKYESGVNHPDSRYLLKARSLGVDIVYVLLGSPEAEREEDGAARELYDFLYRARVDGWLTEEHLAALLALLTSFSPKEFRKTISPRKPPTMSLGVIEPGPSDLGLENGGAEGEVISSALGGS